MALIARGMYKLLLRVHVDQDISQDGWRHLISEMQPSVWEGRQLGSPSFDGEILCISAMSPMDMSAESEMLMNYGFRWSLDLIGADFAWFSMELPKLEWLESKTARPLKAGLPPVELWQLRGSQLQFFVDHEGRVWRRGVDYDW